MSYQSKIAKLKHNNIDVSHVQNMLTSIKQLGDQSAFTYEDVKRELKVLEGQSE